MWANVALVMCISPTSMLIATCGLNVSSSALVGLEETMGRFMDVCALSSKTSDVSVVVSGMTLCV